ncbi:MAG: hypothetical protein JWP28_1867 [Phenylobacterium sp.]|uniref:hypothetical protein n=1 Tax=Phenylobacterium sp. TaxID=1871053 RepID=UPI00262A009D|nr:hypothetical protein [Phenylobacterium sp.]MDB5497836.1 hypothetical protein [Phenylobacterium sp.]
MRHLPPVALAALAALSLAGCDRKKPAPAVPPPPVLAADAAVIGPLAAAVPFRALAETAYDAKPLPLDQAIAAAVAAAEHVKALLPPDAQVDLKTQLDALAAARRVDDRTNVALSAAEAYRVLVSHAPPGRVPAEVHLLDYAALRYDADRKAPLVRWDDMADATTFAQARWNAIAPRVTDPALHNRMAKALADMAAAAARRDPALARDAVTRELEVVNLLDVLLNKPPA